MEFGVGAVEAAMQEGGGICRWARVVLRGVASRCW